MIRKIPFNQVGLVGNEQAYMAQAVQLGKIAGDGEFTQKCHTFLESTFGVPKVLLTTSCTHALEMSALLLDIKPGDEVILPSFTFVSTANAFVLRGAKPIFIDIRPDTLNLDEALLASLITEHTRAIVPVHYAGIGCAMDTIQAITRQYRIAVVEDNAHGLYAKYKGQWLGTFGAMATQSFHETKNFTCGEGGALLINDPAYIDRAEILREKGTNRSRFFRGQVDKYTWVDVGSSYLMSDLLAAFLLAQFQAHDAIQGCRMQAWHYYREALGSWAADNDVRLPHVPDDCEHPAHIFYLIMPTLESRQAFIAYLKEKGIGSAFHYVPLHLSEMGQRFGGKPGDCPVTEVISDRLVRLPLYNTISEADLAYVVETVQQFKP